MVQDLESPRDRGIPMNAKGILWKIKEVLSLLLRISKMENIGKVSCPQKSSEAQILGNKKEEIVITQSEDKIYQNHNEGGFSSSTHIWYSNPTYRMHMNGIR